VTTHDSRDRLLTATVDYVLKHGVSNLTLRALADAIGTSHRMLLYHFGSKEGLLVAVIRAVEAAQREFFAELTTTDPTLSPGDGIRQMWRHFTDPSLAPHERLFFEIYGQALQGRPGTTGLVDDIVDAWVEPVAAYAIERGQPAADARADARLGIAVIRGLLLDLLATGNTQAVSAALERFITQYEAVLAIRTGLEPVQLGVQPTLADEVRVRPALDDPAAGNDQNQVGHPHRRKAVADEQGDRA
jgi:AcrR family transcriptional regulator